jgi:ATP synthase F0 subunit c
MQIANMAAFLGCGIATGMAAIGGGWGAGYTVTGSLRAMVRQPSMQPVLFRSMLINQALATNPSIFGLIISIVLLSKASSALSAPDSLAQASAFLAAGLSIGLGSFGSGLGCGLIGSEAVEAIGRSPKSQSRVTVMMLIGQAWAQTPCIFALVISLMLLFWASGFNTLDAYQNIEKAGYLLGSGLCMGAGAIGPAIGISFVAAKVCRGIADRPSAFQQIRNTFFVGAAVSESTAIYALVICLLLLFGGA